MFLLNNAELVLNIPEEAQDAEWQATAERVNFHLPKSSTMTVLNRVPQHPQHTASEWRTFFEDITLPTYRKMQVAAKKARRSSPGKTATSQRSELHTSLPRSSRSQHYQPRTSPPTP